MSEMKYTTIPYVDKKVSRIFYGTAGEPFASGGDGNALLDAIFALGVNAFDTARVYGGSEESIGKWIEARGNRDQIVLLSKCAHPMPDGTKRVNEQAIRSDFATSSKYLKTDFIDIYLLHRDDPSVEVGPIVEVLNAMHAEGKIGAFGGSNWTYQRVEEANEYAYAHNLIPFTVSSPNFGLADQIADLWGGGSVSISGPSGAEARAWYQEHEMPIIAYSSLARGLFSGRVKSDHPERAGEAMDSYSMKGYACPENFLRLRRCEELAEQKQCTVPQIAMAWIFGQQVKTCAVVSTTKASRMQENIEAMHIALTQTELAYLDLQVDSL
jgi:aryl-alcohol dehydrogenase-like predicted oxidoreductase